MPGELFPVCVSVMRRFVLVYLRIPARHAARVRMRSWLLLGESAASRSTRTSSLTKPSSLPTVYPQASQQCQAPHRIPQCAAIPDNPGTLKRLDPVKLTNPESMHASGGKRKGTAPKVSLALEPSESSSLTGEQGKAKLQQSI